MKQFYMPEKFWKEIREIIPRKRRMGRPRKSSKAVMNAIYFVLRTGIHWKALPPNFSVSASTAHRRFQEWIQDKVFLQFWSKVLQKYHYKNKEMQRWIAIDASFAKAPLGGDLVGPSPVDRRKLGTKKHICVDQNGIVVGVAVSGANRHDNLLTKDVINSIPIALSGHVVFAADSAYDSRVTRIFLKKRGFVPIITKNKRRTKKTVEKIQSRHRWIVERTHSHLNNWRNIFTRWKKKSENYLAAIQIAAVYYTLRYL